MKAFNISKTGYSGQPRVARNFTRYLQTKKSVDARHITLNGSLVVRTIRLIWLLIHERKEGNLMIVHLGIEGALAACLFHWKKAVFINHGIKNFPCKINPQRLLYILLLKFAIKVRKNRFFFARLEHCQVAGGLGVFKNEVDITGLPKPRSARLVKNFGLVGPKSGQKNNRMLVPVIRELDYIYFYHLSARPIKQLKDSGNYIWLSADRRRQFFESVDCLLVPSLYESFCLVAYEAAYVGINVVHSGRDALGEFPFGYNVNSLKVRFFRNAILCQYEKEPTQKPVFLNRQPYGENWEKIIDAFKI